jgi:hypothetical protein
MASIRHPNIVRFIGLCANGDTHYVLMERALGGLRSPTLSVLVFAR